MVLLGNNTPPPPGLLVLLSHLTCFCAWGEMLGSHWRAGLSIHGFSACFVPAWMEPFCPEGQRGDWSLCHCRHLLHTTPRPFVENSLALWPFGAGWWVLSGGKCWLYRCEPHPRSTETSLQSYWAHQAGHSQLPWAGWVTKCPAPGRQTSGREFPDTSPHPLPWWMPSSGGLGCSPPALLVS